MKKICNFVKKFRSFKRNEFIFSNLVKKHKVEKISNYKINKQNLKVILGDGIKRILPSEYETINNQRKCLYALKEIRKGTILNKNHLTVKGPGGGILPKYLDILVGKKAKINIEADYPITWDVF